jgi:electron transfer flavoprotein beta subunit
MMNVVVCVKAVPDPNEAEKVRIDPLTKSLKRVDIPLVMNPHDKNALEEALQLKDSRDAQVSVVSMGPPSAAKVVRECMALGADRGILLSDPKFAGADAYATAFTLAAAIRKIGSVDLILCGMMSSDGSTEWVGPELATLLEIPVVTRVIEIKTREEEWWEVKSMIENGYRKVKVKLPALLTVTRKLNKPRALSFSGVMKSSKMEIIQWGLEDLGVSAALVGLEGSPTLVMEMLAQENKREIQFFTGSREDMADQMTRKLIEVGAI